MRRRNRNGNPIVGTARGILNKAIGRGCRRPTKWWAVIFRCPRGLALNKCFAQTPTIMGRGLHANFIALSDRDLPRLQPANDAVGAIAGLRRYRPLRRGLYVQELWGHDYSYNQNRKVR